MRQKILAFLIAILPVAYIYAFPILINNLGHAILLFLIFPLLLLDFSERKNTKGGNCQLGDFSKRPYVLFSVYLAAVSLIAPVINGFEGDMREMLMAIEFSIIVYFLISDKKISQSFIDIYTKTAVVFALFLLVQYVGFVFFRTTISGAIPFLEEYNREIESISEGRLLRICSVFLEPSHFAVYVIPALLMYLFGKTRQRLIVLKILLLTVSELLSTSSNGILVMGVVYAAFLLYKFFRKINVAYYIVGGALFFGALFLISKSEFINDVTYGLFTEEAGMSMSKAELRVYRGFRMYSELPVDKQIFGVGWRNAANYCKACNSELYSTFSEHTDVFDYFNSIAGTLIYSGAIGLILLLSFFFTMFKSTNDFAARTLIICVLIIMSSSSVLMTDQWILFLATIISLINKYRDEESNCNKVAQCHGNE